MKNYEDMSLDELKTVAKNLGITVGNTGKDKLIEKIKDKESENATLSSVISADDDLADTEPEKKPVVEETPKTTASVLDSITSAIDDLDDSDDEVIEAVEDLPLDYQVPVKSITYGGLIYKSRTTNAVFRWNKIGAIEYMTIGDLIEMNNYKSDFLQKPLVILCDEKAIKKFRLTRVYENVAKINNLTAVFNSDMATIERTIDDALRVNMRDILISKVRQMYKNRKLVDVNILRLLEKKLNFDLMDAE